MSALSVWTRHGSCWRRVLGPWTARLGRRGLSSHKREGDGATPAGTYRFGATMYGIAPNPAANRFALAFVRLGALALAGGAGARRRRPQFYSY